MHRFMNMWVAKVVAAVAAYMLAATSLSAEPHFRFAIFDLGELSGDAANAFGVSDAEHVVGAAFLAGNSIFHAAIFEEDGPRDLGTFGGLLSNSQGVNADGTTVGWAEDADGIDQAFVWDGDSLVQLPTLGGPGGSARAINDGGIVVGISGPPSGDLHATMWIDGEPHDLGAYAYRSEARDINESGQIAGWSNIVRGGIGTTAVLWQNDEMIDLGGLVEGTKCEAHGINDHGNVAGWSFDVNVRYQAVVWSQGEIYDISPEAGIKWSRARAINNDNQVVGALELYGDRRSRGFLWEPATGMQLLDDLVPPNSPLGIESVYDINNHGQIAGIGEEQFGQKWFRAVLLSPVDPELTLSDPVPGVVGQTNTWIITGAQPNAKIHFAYSFNGGGTVVPGCDKLDAVAQLNKPKVVKTVTADANGEATIDLYVPPAASNAGLILFQAVDQQNCEESQLTTFDFE